MLFRSGRWRTFASVAISAATLTAASILVFGPDVFMTFLADLPRTAQSLVTDGAAGWSKLQSLYGLARSLGASNTAAWAGQGAMSLACAVAIIVLWRSRASSDLKAAALAVAATLVTPYVFAYDLPVLGVAAAFLYRHRRFDRWDYAALAVSIPAWLALPTATFPTGLFASLALAAVIARRCVVAMAAPRDGDGALAIE